MASVLIKLSGALTDDPAALTAVADAVRSYREAGMGTVLVHGGGKQMNEWSARMGLPVKQVAGRRITDAPTRDLLAAVLGMLNAGLVSGLRQRGVSAIGLTGADADLTTATRRAPLHIDGVETDFGLVAELRQVDAAVLRMAWAHGLTPVVACMAWNAEHGLLNLNADTFAEKLALASGATELVTLMEPVAVLDAAGKPLAELDRPTFEAGVRAGWITDGMRPKLEAAFRAVSGGVAGVRLTSAAGLLTGAGTRIRGAS